MRYRSHQERNTPIPVRSFLARSGGSSSIILIWWLLTKPRPFFALFTLLLNIYPEVYKLPGPKHGNSPEAPIRDDGISHPTTAQAVGVCLQSVLVSRS